MKKVFIFLFVSPIFLIWFITMIFYLIYLSLFKQLPMDKLIITIQNDSYTKDANLILVLSAMFWIYLYCYLTM